MIENHKDNPSGPDEEKKAVLHFFSACGCVLLGLFWFAGTMVMGGTPAKILAAHGLNILIAISWVAPITITVWVLLLLACAIFAKLPSRPQVRTTFFWSLFIASLVVIVPYGIIVLFDPSSTGFAAMGLFFVPAFILYASLTLYVSG